MDIVYTALPYVLDVVTCLVVTAIGVAGTYLSLKAGQSKKFDTISVAVELAARAAQETVLALQQQLVADWKEEGGKLVDWQKAELRQKLLDISREKLSAPVIGVLEAAKVDVNALITSAGEAMINEMKNG